MSLFKDEQLYILQISQGWDTSPRFHGSGHRGGDELTQENLEEWINNSISSFLTTKIANTFNCSKSTPYAVCFLSGTLGGCGVGSYLNSDDDKNHYILGVSENSPDSIRAACSSPNFSKMIEAWDEGLQVSILFGGMVDKSYEMADFISDDAEEASKIFPEFGCVLIDTDFGILQESSFEGGNCVEGTCADEDDLDVILHEGHDEKLKELAKILT
jgi:hypothetical protein